MREREKEKREWKWINHGNFPEKNTILLKMYGIKCAFWEDFVLGSYLEIDLMELG